MSITIGALTQMPMFTARLDVHQWMSGGQNADANYGGDIQNQAIRWLESSAYLMGFCRNSPTSIECESEFSGGQVRPAFLKMRMIMDPLRSVAGRKHPLLLGNLNDNHAAIRSAAKKVAEKECSINYRDMEYLYDISSKESRTMYSHKLTTLGVSLVCLRRIKPHTQELIEYAMVCYASNPAAQNARVHITTEDVRLFRHYVNSSAVIEIAKRNPSTAWIFDRNLDPPTHYTGLSPLKGVLSDYADVDQARIVGPDGKVHENTQTSVD